MLFGKNTEDETAVLDWSTEKIAEWVRPKWYEKLIVMTPFIIATAWVWINLGTLRGIAMVVATILWYTPLTYAVQKIKEKILAGRIYRAAELRYKAKYAIPRLLKKYPWLHQFLKECKRAEELGWPYAPILVIRDPATAVEVRRPSPEDWTLPLTPQQQPTQQIIIRPLSGQLIHECLISK